MLLLCLQDVIFWGLFYFWCFSLPLSSCACPLLMCLFCFFFPPPLSPRVSLGIGSFAYGAVCREYVSCVSFSCLMLCSCLFSCCVFCSPPSWGSKPLSVLLLCLQDVIFWGLFIFVCLPLSSCACLLLMCVFCLFLPHSPFSPCIFGNLGLFCIWRCLQFVRILCVVLVFKFVQVFMFLLRLL